MGKPLDKYYELFHAYLENEADLVLVKTAHQKLDVIGDAFSAKALLGMQIMFREIGPEELIRGIGEQDALVRDAVMWLDREAMRMGVPLIYGRDYYDEDELHKFTKCVFEEVMEDAQDMMESL